MTADSAAHDAVPLADRVRLLLVENSIQDSELLVSQLRGVADNLETKRVDSAGHLRSALLGGAWDAILVDYTLPGFSGQAALLMCKELAPDAPCIVVTGTLNLEDAVALMRSGVVDCFTKNDLSRLAAAVIREIELARWKTAAREREASLTEENHRLAAESAAKAAEADRLVRQSELMLRAVIDNAPVEIAYFDASGQIQFLGGKGLDTGGTGPEGPGSQLDLMAMGDIGEAIHDAANGDTQVRVMTVSDTGHEWEIRYNSVQAPGAEAGSVVAVAMDITERQAPKPVPPAEAAS